MDGVSFLVSENSGTFRRTHAVFSRLRGGKRNVLTRYDGFLHLNGYNRDLIEAQGFTMTYESLGGTLYGTYVTWTNGVMRTRFLTGIRSAPLPGETRING